MSKSKLPPALAHKSTSTITASVLLARTAPESLAPAKQRWLVRKRAGSVGLADGGDACF
jgi:hypothetical protein